MSSRLPREKTVEDRMG